MKKVSLNKIVITAVLGSVLMTSACIRKPYEASYDRSKLASLSLYGRMISTCPAGQKALCQRQYENFFNDCDRVYSEDGSARACETEMELTFK